MSHLSHEDSVRIINLHKEGKSLHYITYCLSFHPSMASRAIKRYIEDRNSFEMAKFVMSKSHPLTTILLPLKLSGNGILQILALET